MYVGRCGKYSEKQILSHIIIPRTRVIKTEEAVDHSVVYRLNRGRGRWVANFCNLVQILARPCIRIAWHPGSRGWVVGVRVNISNHLRIDKRPYTLTDNLSPGHPPIYPP